MSQEHEYRVVATCPDDPRYSGAGATVDNPKQAGEAYRASREYMKRSGSKGTVELQRRPVAPWETVEKTEVSP